MEAKLHSTRFDGLFRHVAAAVFCAGILCSCSGERPPVDPHVSIYVNDTGEKYLLIGEVIEAPSGELRTTKTGRYLLKNQWTKKEVPKSKLEELAHDEP